MICSFKLTQPLLTNLIQFFFKINIGFNSAVLIYVTIYMKLAFQASVNPIAKMVEHA